MKIQVVKAIGVGSTTIGAFDNALTNAGVENFNLIRLSSVVPESCDEVVEVDRYTKSDKYKHGDKLYCIYACEIMKGGAVSAGIAYDRDADTGLGVFVEHELQVDGTKDVEQLLDSSLDDLFASRGWDKNPENRHKYMVSVNADEAIGDTEDRMQYVCAFVIAVVEEEGWAS